MKPPAGRADSASPWRAPKTNGPRHAATGAAQHAERSLPGAIPVLVLRVTPIGHMPTANAQRAGVEGHTWKESRAGGARGCQIGDMGAARLWKAAQGQRFHGRPARSFASSACPFSWQHFFGGAHGCHRRDPTNSSTLAECQGSSSPPHTLQDLLVHQQCPCWRCPLRPGSKRRDQNINIQKMFSKGYLAP